MAALYQSIEEFLVAFKVKAKIYGVLFRTDRGKNIQTLLDLEITEYQAKEELLNLAVSDFSHGPIEDALYSEAQMWVFGKEIKKKEIYIKITLGKHNNSPVCISFHEAEFPLSYPLRI